MAGSAIIPSNEHDPTGAGRRVKGAQNVFAKKLNAAYRQISALIKSLDYEVVNINHNDRLLTLALHVDSEQPNDAFKSVIVTNSAQGNTQALNALISSRCDDLEYSLCDIVVNESFYTYKLNPFELMNINATIKAIVDDLFMVDKSGNLINETQVKNLWFMDVYVEPAYIQGTAQEQVNLSVQSAAYAASRPDVESVMFSEPYQRRIGLVAAREFEVMEGFTGNVTKSARQILSSGIVAGQSPAVIARSLKKMFDTTPDETGKYHGNMARANRIARTDITYALKTARLDESLSAEATLGIKSLQMHISALIPTTRQTHAIRHGELFTQKEVREFYAVDGNAISCLCSQVSVVLGDDGKPLSVKSIDRAKKQKDNYLSTR